MSFAVTVLPAVAGHRWLCIEGTVDATTVGDVRGVLRSALRTPTLRLTVDLSQARLDDPAGRECVVDIAMISEAAGVDLLFTFDGAGR